ncbi:MAG: transcriptional regulator, AraC family [Paenibacillus sp.]|nr:transcriptional regulator, AraC family [Paenibacillus sp.]
MKSRSPRFLIRLMVISILVGTIPVLALGSFAYYFFSSKIQKQVDLHNVQLLTETELRLEQLFMTIDFYVTQLANSPLLQDAADWELSNRRFQSFQELSVQLSRLQSFEMGISDVFYVNFTNKWVIDNRGTAGLPDRADRDLLASYAASNRSSYWMSEGSDGEVRGRSVLLIKKTPLTSLSPSGVLGIRIPRYELEKRIQATGGSDVQLIANASFDVLAKTQGTLLLGEGLSPEFAERVTKALEGAPSAIVRYNEQYFTVVKKSNYNGWYYFSFYSNAEITKDSRTIRWITLLACVGVLLLTLLAATIMNRRVYVPIRRLYEAAGGQSITGKGNRPDEFQLIGTRIESLISVQDRMNDQIRGQALQLRELFLFKLLLGEVNPSEVEQKAQFYQLDFKWKQMKVIAVQFSDWKQSKYEDKDWERLMFALSNIMCELTPGDRRLEPIIIGQYQIMIVGTDLEDVEAFRESMVMFANHLKESVHLYLGLTTMVGVSKPYARLLDTHRAFREASESLKHRSVTEEQSLFFFGDLFPGRDVRVKYPAALEKQLFQAVSELDRTGAQTALRGITKWLLAENVNYRELQLHLVRILIGLVGDSLYSEEPLRGLMQGNKTVFEQLFELDAIDDIEVWFEERVLTPLMNWREEQSQRQYKIITEQMLKLVHERYDSELTLEKCAEQLNFHPDYLRRVFRRGVGVNFSDYLGEYRLNLSKELLKNTEMTIAEIAQKMNYQNSQNFIRYFKKTVGITPGQFRERLHQS